jgi:MerR family Zn(II)-responsive transcriptional regulator of zntA
MRVNDLAKKVKVTPDTVRYCTRIGLLTPTKSSDYSYKNYTNEDEKRLVFILKARHLGFAVTEIEEINTHSKSLKLTTNTVGLVNVNRLH